MMMQYQPCRRATNVQLPHQWGLGLNKGRWGLPGSACKHRAVTATAGADHQPLDTIISLPLFPLPSVLHPSQMGSLLVYEARYLTMMRELQTASTARVEAKFGHILAPSSAPPVLMQDSIGGYPPIGVCAGVKSFQEFPNGRLQVNYQGLRRFKLLAVDNDAHPYPVAAATWLDDDLPKTFDQQSLTEQLELDVFSLLQQVARYSKLLEEAASTSAQQKQLHTSCPETAAEGITDGSQKLMLPDALLMYAPPPPQKQSVAEYMKKAGIPAGDRIATWQRMGSVYGDTAAKKKAAQDPYQLMRNQLGKERRQELFSFAAASLLDLGMAERLALLQSKDTAARLQFVAVAVQPYLQDLVARVSVQQAMSPW